MKSTWERREEYDNLMTARFAADRWSAKDDVVPALEESMSRKGGYSHILLSRRNSYRCSLKISDQQYRTFVEDIK